MAGTVITMGLRRPDFDGIPGQGGQNRSRLLRPLATWPARRTTPDDARRVRETCLGHVWEILTR